MCISCRSKARPISLDGRAAHDEPVGASILTIAGWRETTASGLSSLMASMIGRVSSAGLQRNEYGGTWFLSGRDAGFMMRAGQRGDVLGHRRVGLGSEGQSTTGSSAEAARPLQSRVHAASTSRLGADSAAATFSTASTHFAGPVEPVVHELAQHRHGRTALDDRCASTMRS